MDNRKRSRSIGTFLTSVAVLTLATTSGVAVAQTATTVNGIDIAQSTFEQYFENRVQKPFADGTPIEKDQVLQELTDIYLLATLPEAEELSNQEPTKSQLELQYRAIVAQAVVADWLANNPATDEEIQQAYAEQTLLAPDLQFKARHILVETQSAAQELIVQLDGGASFEELAKDHSTGPSGPSGGDLGWFAPNQMVAPFSDAVSALENGAYTKEPVQTEFGWHVILREDSRNNEPPPLDSVRDVLKQNIEQQKFQAFLEGLRTTAD